MGSFLNMMIRKIKKISAIVAIVLGQLLPNLLKKKSRKFFNKIKNLINKRFYSKIY